MAHPALQVRAPHVRVLLVLAALLAFGRPAQALPVLGFVEDFPGISTSSWGGGSIITNPGTGGFGGAGDGYLDVKTLTAGNLGAVSFGLEYAGDWTAAGVTQVRCRLKDIGGTGNLEIHLSLSNGAQTWQQNAGLIPPRSLWGLYVVNLVAGDFTRIRGTTGTFASVMQSADRLHFRHDLAPFTAGPDPVQGELGLDHIELGDGSNTAVAPGGLASHPVLLAPPYPNPARGRVTFQIQQPEARPVRITILDAAGRRVRDLELGAAGAAPRLWLWDGNDDAGRPAPAGVYRVLARGDNGGMSRTVTLIR